MIYTLDKWKPNQHRRGNVVLTGGFFDPCHTGHINLLDYAYTRICYDMSVLVIAINSDEATIQKKGYCLLPFEQRAEIIERIIACEYGPSVHIVKNDHLDMIQVIKKIRPNFYAKGGDRTCDNMLQPEVDLCASIGCEIIYGVGGYDKAGSSSDFFKKAMKQYHESLCAKQE
jgi:cytidyltransferase-like protein